MRKETIIAVLLGIGLGVGVATAVTIKTKKQEVKKSAPISNTLKVTPTVSINNFQTQSLEIAEPLSGAITTVKTIKIKGKAAKGGLVVIQSPINTEIFQNEDIEFTLDFPLALGENVIMVTFYPKEQQSSTQEKELKVYYLED